jgi:hypothetical protein
MERQHTLLLTRNVVPVFLSKFGLTEARVSKDLLDRRERGRRVAS